MISLMIQLVVVSDNFSCLSEWLMCAVHSRELCSWSTLNIQVGNHTSHLNILAGCPCWYNLWWGNQKYQCQFRHQDIPYRKTTSQTRPTHHTSHTTAVKTGYYWIFYYLYDCHNLENNSNVNKESLHFAAIVSQMLLNWIKRAATE